MASLVNTTIYKPIDPSSQDLRLIILEPSDDPQESTDIRCSLVHAPHLAFGKPYEALSYEWGSAGSEKPIFINGSRVLVRSNLWDALWHLRMNIRRTLWIDAICINQANTAERNHQVRLMKNIYANASRVVIWLGLEAGNSGIALDAINNHGSLVYDGRPIHLQSEVQRAVRHLCKRSYWNRLWIVQEVVVARSAIIQCGSHNTTWDSLKRFRDVFSLRLLTLANYFEAYRPGIQELRDLKSTVPFELCRHQVSYQQAPNGYSLRSLLQSFSSSLCAEPRDKIYGLIGLIPRLDKFPIDYSRSVFEIYLDVIKLEKFSESALLVSYSQLVQSCVAGRSSIPSNPHYGQEKFGMVGYETGNIVKFGPYCEDISTLHKVVQHFNGPFFNEFPSLRHDVFNKHANTEFKTGFTSNDLGGSGRRIFNSMNYEAITREVISIQCQQSYGKSGGTGFVEAYQVYPLDKDKFSRVPQGYFSRLFAMANFMATDQTIREYEEEEAEPRYFSDDLGNLGIAPSNSRTGDAICRFMESDILAVVRWSAGRFMFVGRAVLLPRKNENKLEEKAFGKRTVFSAPKESQLWRINFVLTASTLQRLTG